MDPRLVIANLITMGYLTYDFNVIIHLLNPEGQFLTKVHHIGGIIGIIAAFIGGYGQVFISAQLLITEISTINLSYRNMY